MDSPLNCSLGLPLPSPVNTELLSPGPAYIQHCAQALLKGQLVAFPTETVFGLGAAVTQLKAVEAIFAAKGRPTNHPLIAHVAWSWVEKSLATGAQPQLGQQQLEHQPARADVFTGLHPWVGALNAQQQADWRALAQAFWPGPLTLIVPRGPAMPLQVTGGQETVGIRCPSHPVAQALLEAVGVPVAAPSANRFGKVSPTRAAHVLAELGGRIPYVLDGEVPSVGIESTIASLLGPQPVVLRPGAIVPEQLAQVLGRAVLGPQQQGGGVGGGAGVGGAVLQGGGGVEAAEPLRVSGLLAQHYSPNTPLILCRASDLAAMPHAGGAAPANAAPILVVGWGPEFVAAATALQAAAPQRFELRILPAEPARVAQNLYLVLRQADEGGYGQLVFEAPPEHAAWAGVADRLRRAANQG